MERSGIRRYLYMAKDAAGKTLAQGAFRERYGFEAAGVNAYFGLNESAARRLQTTGSALGPIHRAVLDDLQRRLLEGSATEKWVDLGLWPYEPVDPYCFVTANLALVKSLARELAGYQEEAHQVGRSLEVVVRYAAEMNDPATAKQPWGRGPLDDAPHQRAFQNTFRQVREVFRRHAPAVRFAFCPALRRDNGGERYRIIRDYWPGEAEVDVIGCTWYVGRSADLPGAIDALRRYTRDWRGVGLPFGIDEMGGVDETRNNDGILRAMLRALTEPSMPAYEYAGLFLEGKWGVDATLAFLRPPPPDGGPAPPP